MAERTWVLTADGIDLGPSLRAGEVVTVQEVVESREPFPSDEDVERGQIAILELWESARPLGYAIKAEQLSRAVLDAVSSHRDDEARER